MTKKDITKSLWKYEAKCENCGADILKKCWKCKDELWFMKENDIGAWYTSTANWYPKMKVIVK